MDEIIRMMTGDGMVKAVAVTGKDMVERARQIHKTLPVATAALGRTLMAASMMGDMLKEEDGSVTLQIKGGGPLGAITAVSDSRGNPRGYLQNGQVDIPRKYQGKLDVGTAVGSSGSLTVMKDMGLKEPYIGSVQLVSGEIAEDITAYFVESEQVPTACALGVLVDRDLSILTAGGYLLQLLPGASDAEITHLEQNVAALPSVTELLRSGASLEQIMEQALAGFAPNVLDEQQVRYQCDCSQARVERALLSLGRDELAEMAAEGKPVEVSCHFCDKKYYVDAGALLGETKG